MRSKNRGLLALVISAVVLCTTPLAIFADSLPKLSDTKRNRQSDPEIQVNPIPNLSPDFIMGADVSMLKQIEDSGGKFTLDGVEQDALSILKAHGVNWIRLRIWNDPTDATGAYLGGGNNDLEKTVEIATRAKNMGFKFLLDFHYSDWWTDPGKQNIPKAWVGLRLEDLKKALYDYTVEVIQTLAQAGAMPDMVQLGNEVNGGMLWPLGATFPQGTEVIGGYDGFAELLKMASKAVRDTDPHNDDPKQRTKIVIHVANGGDNALFRTVFDALTERGVDYDVIGLSYYGYWHGALYQLKTNLKDISARYQKDVVIAETAYAFTLEEKDGHSNLFGEGDQAAGGYKATVQGQATAIRDVMAAVAEVPKGRGLGVFYWEPDWIAVDGAGWKTGEGNAWENQALFDFEGEALPSMAVFHLVKPNSGSVTVPAALTEIYPLEVKVPVNGTPKIPSTVKGAFSDDSIRTVVVTWDMVDPAVFKTAGQIVVHGTVQGSDLKANLTIHVVEDLNLVKNPGFESGQLSPWVIEGDQNAVDISTEAQNLHEGSYALHYWLGTSFAFTLSQTITDLPEGDYTLSAWIQGGGGEKTLQLFISGCGGDERSVDVVTDGWQRWKQPSIEKIQITGGTCTIGLKVASEGGSWAFLDEVKLLPVEKP